MNSRTKTICFGISLIVWGGVLLYFYSSGRMAQYLAEQFRNTALWGALAMMVLGLFNIITAKQEAACCGEAGEEHDHDHSDLHPGVVLFTMIVPVLAASFLTKDMYSQNVLARKGLYNNKIDTKAFFNQRKAFTKETLEQNTKKTEDGHYLVDLLDIYFAVSEPEMRAIFDGLPISLSGHISTDAEDAKPNHLRLYRIYVMCCAADSRPIPITLEFSGEQPDPNVIKWITAKGKLAYVKEDGIDRAILRVTSYEASQPPANAVMELLK